VLTLIGFILVGLVAGYGARIAVPGPDGLGIFGTLVLGMVGSFVGGLLWNLFAGDGALRGRSGLAGAILGTIITLLIYRALTARRT
jgi:uncharacterized membrane protein YeaQ/YmgE (transglycosylase-associated protein family)